MLATSRLLELIVRAKDEASSELKKIGSALDGLRTKANNAFNSVVSGVFSLQGALAGAGIGLFVKSFIDAARETEGYRMQLRILTGDVERGNQLFKEAADYASKVTFEYRDIMGVVTQLRGVIKGSDKEVVKWLQIVGDVAAATGIDIRTTTEQISRMYSAGAQSAELFKERGKLAMLGFTTGVSYSVAETRKKIEEMWTKSDSPIRGAAAELANTWDGLLSMISDKWFQFRTIMMEQSGIFNYLKAWVKTYVDYLNKMVTEDTMANWAQHTGEVVIGSFEKMAMAAGYLGTSFQGIGIIMGGAGKLIAWVVNLVLDGADKLGVFARYVIGLVEQFASYQTDIANSRFTPGWLKESMLESAIRITGQLKQWRISLKEGDDQINAIRSGIKELDDDSTKLLNNFINQIPVHERIRGLLIQVRDLAKTMSDPSARATGGIGTEEEKKVAKRSEILKAGFQKLQADLELELAFLQSQFDQRLIDLNTYYDRRREIILQRTNAEIALQKEMLKTQEISENPEKVLDIKTKIYELEKKQLGEIIKLEQERREKTKAFAEQQENVARMVEDIRKRTEVPVSGNLGATFEKELRDMDFKHQEEIKKMKEQQAAKAQLEDAYILQRIEKQKLISDQQRRLDEALLQQAQTTFGQMETMFGDLYEVSGKKMKAFFYLQKAASIATTIVSTYEAAQKAYTTFAAYPHVAAAAAAVATAAGMARIAVIASQTLAEGGEVKGHSPHSRADNIPARLTAGEFVHPVDAVNYYGKGIMEGLRKKTIPRSLLAGYALPSVGPARRALHFAAGGAVGEPKYNSNEVSAKEQTINLINFVDPAMLGSYLASVPGQKQLINVIGSNPAAFQNALFGGAG
jgi:hypothetical protein